MAGGAGLLADRIGLPAGYLFGGMLAALCFALARPGRLRMPDRTFKLGQAVAGVVVGTFLQGATFGALGWRWVAVVGVGAATLAVTAAAGLLLARYTAVDRASAALGMVAGGASGMVAMADDLGGDERLVAFMQYARLIAVTFLTTLVIPIAFDAHASADAAGASPGLLGTPAGWALVGGGACLGAALGSLLRLPAPFLLGPMIVTGTVTLTGLLPADVTPPPIVQDAAFALIGVRVGLGLDLAELRRIASLGRPVAISVAALIGVCFLLGWVLALTADVPLLDGYLATTPGGILAVLPIAYGSGADTTFVIAAQSLRLVGMVLVAPLAVRLIVGGRGSLSRR